MEFVQRGWEAQLCISDLARQLVPSVFVFFIVLAMVFCLTEVKGEKRPSLSPSLSRNANYIRK